MYIISVIVEKNQSCAALYDKEYKLLAKKEGADASKLCIDLMADGIKAADVDYIGVVADSSDAADIEKSTGVKCYTASVMGARALGEAYLSNDVPFAVLLKVDDNVECGLVMDKKIYTGVNGQGVNVANMVIDFGGYECCSCGRRGCFKAYASNAGLKRIAVDCGVADAEITHKALFAMDTPEAENAKKLYV